MVYFNAQLRREIRQAHKLCEEFFHGRLNDGHTVDAKVRGARRFLNELPPMFHAAIEAIETNMLKVLLSLHFDGRPLGELFEKRHLPTALAFCRVMVERTMELATFSAVSGLPITAENCLQTFDGWGLYSPDIFEKVHLSGKYQRDRKLSPEASRRLDQAFSAGSKIKSNTFFIRQGTSNGNLQQKVLWNMHVNTDLDERLFYNAVTNIRQLREVLASCKRYDDPEFAAIELANYLFYSCCMPVATGNPVEAYYASRERFYKPIDKKRPTYPTKSEWVAWFRKCKKKYDQPSLYGDLFDHVGTMGFRTIKGAMDYNRAWGIGCLIQRFLNIPLQYTRFWVHTFSTLELGSATPDLFLEEEEIEQQAG